MLASRNSGVKESAGAREAIGRADLPLKIAYFDTGSGISGDMTVAALLDAGSECGLSLERLSGALATIRVGGYHVESNAVDVNGFAARSFNVIVDEPQHHHRTWTTIRGLLEEAGRNGLAAGVVERSMRVFEVLARAEARVHGVEPDAVHFHEVGAIDSIVDIVGAAWCLDELGIDACFVGAVPSGSGYVDTEHGRLPVPTPATAELLRGYEIIAGDGKGELVTPTGAAILNALARPLRPAFDYRRIGCGAGTMRLDDRPNVLRVFIGECEGVDDEQVFVLEADIDDMTPEALAHVAERLRTDGARDVSVEPVHMKKGRLGMRLTVLCDLERLESLSARVLAESSSIGLRYRALGRAVLPRRIEVVETSYGTIALKVVGRPGGKETAEPEFEDVSRAARQHDVAFADVRRAALVSWEQARTGG